MSLVHVRWITYTTNISEQFTACVLFGLCDLVVLVIVNPFWTQQFHEQLPAVSFIERFHGIAFPLRIS